MVKDTSNEDKCCKEGGDSASCSAESKAQELSLKISDKCCDSVQKSCHDKETNLVQSEKKCCSTKKSEETVQSCCKKQDKANADAGEPESCCTADSKKSCQNDSLVNKQSCCSTEQPREKQCNSKTTEPSKTCCSTNKEEEVCNKDQKQGVSSCCSNEVPQEKVSCCSSKAPSTCSKKVEEPSKKCCSTNKEDEVCNKDQKQAVSSCCSNEVPQEKVSCCSSPAPTDESNAMQNIKQCCADEATATIMCDCCSSQTTCSASQAGPSWDKEIEPRNDECCTKEETVLLIEPTENQTKQPKNGKPQLSRRNTTKLRVQNICCAMEAHLVEECLKPLKGIDSVAVNVIGRVVHVRHDPEVTSPTELVDCLNKVHLGATVMEIGSHRDHGEEQMPRVLKLTMIYVLIQAVLLVTAVSGLFLKEGWYKWFAIAEIVFGGVPILKNSFYALKNRRMDINILMLIAIIGTLAISEWVEGATVVFVFAVADALQEFCMFRVQRTISRLMLKRPEIAVLVETGESVLIENVPVGTLIAVRPGELIPLDGIVVKGRAAVDESSITGEALPVEKTVMSTVFSGTVNQNGYIEVETTSDSSSSTVSKVAQLVQEAQSSSTVTEAIINRFAKFYTPLVVLISALLVVIPAILGAAGVGTYLQDIREWGRRALVMLVISCPCALVMATPIAIVCSISAAARKGALVKGGEFLETLSKLQVLAFDKTGTLTEGKFQVTNMESADGENERDVLRLAAGLESKTVHPISAAIVNEFSGCVAEMVKNQTVILPEVTQFEMYEGQGISGLIEGKRVRVGNKDMLDKCGASLNENLYKKYQFWSGESKTVVFVCVDDKVSLMIALADEIRPNTGLSLDWLRDIGVQTSMITGDNTRTAQAVKTKLTLDECVSEMKPHDKLQWIKEKQTSMLHDNTNQSRLCCRKPRDRHLIVGMVGDGVNDGPALASANVGIAMGAGGTALAVEAADVALMSNNLAKIPELITLARFCNRVIKQNISASVLLKIVIVIVALTGYVTLWMAVVADVLGLLVVILNGLRPLYWKPSKSQRKAPLDVELGLKRTTYNYESIA